MENRQIRTVVIPDMSTASVNLLRVPTGHSYTVEDAWATTNVDIAANGTVYDTVALVNGGTAGTSTTAISGTAGGTAGWSKNVAQEMAIISAKGKLTAGQWLVAQFAKNGSPTAAAMSITVEFMDGIGYKANS